MILIWRCACHRTAKRAMPVPCGSPQLSEMNVLVAPTPPPTNSADDYREMFDELKHRPSACRSWWLIGSQLSGRCGTSTSGTEPLKAARCATNLAGCRLAALPLTVAEVTATVRYPLPSGRVGDGAPDTVITVQASHAPLASRCG